MEIKKFAYNELEKGYRGIVDRFGDFYALDEIGNIDPIHQEMLPKYLKDNGIDIVDKFEKMHLTPEKADKVKAPMIQESPVNTFGHTSGPFFGIQIAFFFRSRNKS